MRSGIAEIVGGAAVLAPPTRRLGGLWLIAVLVAVFPANLYMAREPEQFDRSRAGRCTRGCPSSR